MAKPLLHLDLLANGSYVGTYLVSEIGAYFDRTDDSIRKSARDGHTILKHYKVKKSDKKLSRIPLEITMSKLNNNSTKEKSNKTKKKVTKTSGAVSSSGRTFKLFDWNSRKE